FVDPKLFCDPTKLPDLQLYDPTNRQVDTATAIALAKKGEAAARAFDPRITNSEDRTFRRTTGGTAIVLSNRFRTAYKKSYQSLSIVPVTTDENGKNRHG